MCGKSNTINIHEPYEPSPNGRFMMVYDGLWHWVAHKFGSLNRKAIGSPSAKADGPPVLLSGQRFGIAPEMFDSIEAVV
jgi:hypothetical protein